MSSTTSRFPWVFLYACALGAWAIVCRLAPYYFDQAGKDFVGNLMPIGAFAFFVGSRLRGWWAILLPPTVMLVSDLALIVPLRELGYPAFYAATPLIYGSYCIYLLLGRLCKADDWSPLRIGGLALAGSCQFFLVTNYLSWQFDIGNLYSRDMTGLMVCFEAGLPFFRSTVTSDLAYTAAFFAVHGLLLLVFSRDQRSSEEQKVSVSA